MIGWIDRMLHRRPAHQPPPPPVLSPADQAALEREKGRVQPRLDAADEAVRSAMAHADAIFRGTERRRRPR